MDTATIYKVVHALVGDIVPVGSSHIDEVRYENLKILTDLIDKLLGDLSRVTGYKERVEYSMKRSGKYAYDFLKEIKEADIY